MTARRSIRFNIPTLDSAVGLQSRQQWTTKRQGATQHVVMTCSDNFCNTQNLKGGGVENNKYSKQVLKFVSL